MRFAYISLVRYARRRRAVRRAAANGVPSRRPARGRFCVTVEARKAADYGTGNQLTGTVQCPGSGTPYHR